MRSDVVLISSLRDEGPFILEWVAHHLVVGFDAIYIASNDCDDGSSDLLDALQNAGAIGHLRSEVPPGQIPQHVGYEGLRHKFPIDDAAWLMMLDTDEFLNIHLEDGTVQSLIRACGPQVDIIAINAQTFESQPLRSWQPGWVTREFAMALPAKHFSNTAIKTLTHHPNRFRSIHNHHMVRYTGHSPLTVFRAGDGVTYQLDMSIPLWEQLRSCAKEDVSHDLAQYNHYATKTLDSFLLRQQRGRGARPKGEAVNDRHTLQYFIRRTGESSQNRSIVKYQGRVRELYDELLSIDEVRECHRSCESAYAEKIRALDLN